MYDNHVSYFCLNLAQCTTISSVYETELKWVSVIYPIKSIKEIFKFYINLYTNLYKSSTSCLLNIYIYGVDVVEGAGRKAKRMVLQCINGVSSNPVEGKNLTALKSNSNTVWFNFHTCIHVYILKLLYIYCSFCHFFLKICHN